MFEEKREFQRYPMVGKVVITTKDNREIPAHITNISFSGIGVYSADYLAELTNVMIRIMFTDSCGKEHEVPIDGIVSWVVKTGKVYEMGIRFYNYLSYHNKPVLLEHLCQIAAKVKDI